MPAKVLWRITKPLVVEYSTTTAALLKASGGYQTCRALSVAKFHTLTGVCHDLHETCISIHAPRFPAGLWEESGPGLINILGEDYGQPDVDGVKDLLNHARLETKRTIFLTPKILQARIQTSSPWGMRLFSGLLSLCQICMNTTAQKILEQ